MLLVVDIGTSNFKAAILGFDGAWHGFAERPLEVLSEEGRHEARPEAWLDAFAETAAALGNLDGLEALLICGNGPTVIPVTGEPALRNGRLVLPSGMARLWLDRRAEEESRIVSELAGDYVDPSFFLPKILAVKRREPELYEKTRHFLATPEFLAYALTGEARTVFPSEGFTRWYWDDAALDRCGIDREKMPPFVPPGVETGTVLPQVAAQFGLPPGLRVFAGGPDFFVSILGTGVTAPGECCDRSGTSEGVNVCTKERIIDPRLMSYGHPVKGFWNLSGIISTTGMAVSWARELLGRETYGDFFGLAGGAAAGAGGVTFLPYLAGERAPLWDPRARGLFAGLSLSTGPAELARAVAEGICYAIRDVSEVMEERGAPVRDFRVSGGTAESPVLNQIKADVTGRPVIIPAHTEAELAGLGVIGATALGKYSSFAEAAGAIVRMEREYLPNPANERLHAEGFARYRELYRALKPLEGS